MRPGKPFRLTWLVSAMLLAGAAAAVPRDAAQARLGPGLVELVEWQSQTHADLANEAARSALQGTSGPAALARFDDAGRVLVQVHLDGRATLQAVLEGARALGATPRAQAPTWRLGAFAAYVAPARAAALADLPGVRSVVLALPAVSRVGKATSQGVPLMHSDQANALGYDGRGITVAAMSDSYATSYRPLTNERNDARSDDLPGPGNAAGHLDPVVVVSATPRRSSARTAPSTAPRTTAGRSPTPARKDTAWCTA